MSSGSRDSQQLKLSECSGNIKSWIEKKPITHLREFRKQLEQVASTDIEQNDVAEESFRRIEERTLKEN